MRSIVTVVAVVLPVACILSAGSTAATLPSPDQPACPASWQCLNNTEHPALYVAFRLYEPDQTKVEFVIYGVLPNGGAQGGYVSVGFNIDRGPMSFMPLASIIECVRATNGDVRLVTSYATTHAPPESLQPSDFGVELLASSLEAASGRLMCHLTRATAADYSLAPERFGNLADMDCIIMAHGRLKDTGNIDYHGTGKSLMGCHVSYLTNTSTTTQPTSSTARPTGTPAVTPTLPSSLPSPGNCANDFGCMSDVSRGLFVAFKSYDHEHIQVVVTAMSGVSAAAGGWVGVGFNVDKDGSGTASMAEASIVECVLAPNGTIHLFTGYAATTAVPQRLDPPNFGVELLETHASDGKLTCHFLRKISAAYQPNPHYFYDLNNATCVIMAHGDLKAGGDNLQIEYHNTNRAPFGCHVDFNGNFTSHVTTQTPLLIRLHGSLMTVAWLFFINCGITIARYYKNTWQNKCLGKDAWFRHHQTYQTTGLLLMIGGVVCAFVYVGGWIDMSIRLVSIHAICGIVAVGLAVLQPCMALFRCDPDDKNRWIFNAFHRTFGTVAFSLAVACVFLGARLPQAEFTDSNLDYWLILCYTAVGLVVLVTVLLELIKCCAVHADLSNRRASEVASNSNTQLEPITKVTTSSRTRSIQKVVLCFYSLLMAALCVLLILILNNVISFE